MRTAILILGMHRSGTSAITWLLGQAGADLPIDPLPPQPDNPMGSWESQAMVAAHNRLLTKLQSSWFDTRALDWHRRRQETLQTCKADIRAAIEFGWPDTELLAIKDPRICRFVPLISEVLGEMEIACRTVLALRSPDSVAASLVAHEGMGANYGRLLWLRHMMDAEQATRDMPRVAINYDEVIEDWRSAVPALSRITGRSWNPDAEQQAKIDAYLRSELRHNTDVTHETKATPPAMGDRIWRGLNALIESDDRDARQELTRAYCRFHDKEEIEGDTLHAELCRLRRQKPETWSTDSAASNTRSLHIHVFAKLSSRGPQSSAYIRLLRPLSEDVVKDKVRLSLSSWDNYLPECDVCIVQRNVLPDVDAALRLIEMLGKRGVPLIIDLDDGFSVMSAEQIGANSARRAALDLLLGASTENWFSTAALADLYPAIRDRSMVIENAIDPRLWRDWRRLGAARIRNSKTRFLYMGTSTHADDFKLIQSSLENLWQKRPGQFDVTLIGIAAKVKPATWLSHIKPPPDCTQYPKFVVWLREQGPYDIGLAPLADTPFNRVKSDIKLLDYSALGLRSLVSDSIGYRSDPAFKSAIVKNWPEALRGAIDNPERARAEANAATQHVWLNRTTPGIAVRLVDRLEILAGRRVEQT